MDGRDRQDRRHLRAPLLALPWALRCRHLPGPLPEIHDLSPPKGPGTIGALFGFTGLAPGSPAPSRGSVLNQLVRLFGEEASQPTGFHQQDWSREPRTSPPGVTKLQDYDLFGHPAYRAGHWQDHLYFASCETGGPDGHIESALKASEHVVGRILKATQ